MDPARMDGVAEPRNPLPSLLQWLETAGALSRPPAWQSVDPTVRGGFRGGPGSAASPEQAGPILGGEGDVLVLLGEWLGAGSGSRVEADRTTMLDEARRGLRGVVHCLVAGGGVCSVQECGPGGVLGAVAQAVNASVENPLGATIELERLPAGDAMWLEESTPRMLLTTRAVDGVKIVERAKILGVPALRLGEVGGDRLVIRSGNLRWEVSLTELRARGRSEATVSP